MKVKNLLETIQYYQELQLGTTDFNGDYVPIIRSFYKRDSKRNEYSTYLERKVICVTSVLDNVIRIII